PGMARPRCARWPMTTTGGSAAGRAARTAVAAQLHPEAPTVRRGPANRTRTRCAAQGVCHDERRNKLVSALNSLQKEGSFDQSYWQVAALKSLGTTFIVVLSDGIIFRNPGFVIISSCAECAW